MSFDEIKTRNIDTVTINNKPYVPSEGSQGPNGNLNTATGTGEWQPNALFIIDTNNIFNPTSNIVLSDTLGNYINTVDPMNAGDFTIMAADTDLNLTSNGNTNFHAVGGAFGWGDTITRYATSSVPPSALNQVMACATLTPPAIIAWQDQSKSLFSSSELISDTTNATINSYYVFSSFNVSAISPVATQEPIITFPMPISKSFKIIVTIASTNTPLSAGSLQVGVGQFVASDAGGGNITYTVTPIAASVINIPAAGFPSSGGSFTTNFSTSSAYTLAGVFCILPTATVWTLNSTVNISVQVIQNN